ncbi:MAG: OmpA family protein [Deltaproteobacteria bacterium]|nr:OmpA family protein [Deltaproteobacteria bacterium]
MSSLSRGCLFAVSLFANCLFLCGFDVERATGSASGASYSQLGTIDDEHQTFVLQSCSFYANLPLQYSDSTSVVRHLFSEQLALSWQFLPRFSLKMRAGGAFVPKVSGNHRHLGFSSKDVQAELFANPWVISKMKLGGGLGVRVPAFGLRNLGEGSLGLGAHLSARLDVIDKWLRLDAQLKTFFATQEKSGVEVLVGAELSWLSFRIPIEIIHKTYVVVGKNVWMQHPTEARIGLSMLWSVGRFLRIRTGVFAGTAIIPGVGAPLFRAGFQISAIFLREHPEPSIQKTKMGAPADAPREKKLWRPVVVNEENEEVSAQLKIANAMCKKENAIGHWTCYVPDKARVRYLANSPGFLPSWGVHRPENLPTRITLLRNGKLKPKKSVFDAPISSTVVFFDTNESSLDSQSIIKLNQLQIASDCYDLLVVIRGHADKRGDEHDNLALSSRRARAVRSYFQGRGCDDLWISSHGEQAPWSFGETTEELRSNRRAEVLVFRRRTNDVQQTNRVFGDERF